MATATADPVVIGRKTGIWQVEEAFAENRDFFAARGIESADELLQVVEMIPGYDLELTKEIYCTFGFSVNFVSRRVSGYALEVDQYDVAKEFYYPEQRVMFVTVIAGTAGDGDFGTGVIKAKVRALVEEMIDQDMWAADAPGENETRSETDARAFVSRGVDDSDLYLYVKGSVPVSQTDLASKVNEQTLGSLTRRNRIARENFPVIRQEFFGKDFEDTTTMQYYALTNTFVKVGGKYYFINDCIFVDPNEDTILLFDNHDKALKIHRASAEEVDVKSMFKYPPTTPAQRENTRLVALESPLSDARIDVLRAGAASVPSTKISIEYEPEMLERDEKYHRTIRYKKLAKKDMPVSRQVIWPSRIMIQQGPVYHAKDPIDMPLPNLIKLAKRIGDESVAIATSAWGPLKAGLKAVEKANLTINSVQFTKTAAYFPTGALADHFVDSVNGDVPVSETNGH